MNHKEFEALIGWPPNQDDLHRANCDQEGEIGHMSCGICDCGKPRFVCDGVLGNSVCRTPKPVDPLEVPGDPNALDLTEYTIGILADKGINPRSITNADPMTMLEQEIMKVMGSYVGMPNDHITQDAIKFKISQVVEHFINIGIFSKW